MKEINKDGTLADLTNQQLLSLIRANRILMEDMAERIKLIEDCLR